MCFGILTALIEEGVMKKITSHDLFNRDRTSHKVLVKAITSYKYVPPATRVLFTLRPHPLRERRAANTGRPIAIHPTTLGRDAVVVKESKGWAVVLRSRSANITDWKLTLDGGGRFESLAAVASVSNIVVVSDSFSLLRWTIKTTQRAKCHSQGKSLRLEGDGWGNHPIRDVVLVSDKGGFCRAVVCS